MTPELEEYILTHIDKEDELLASLDRNTHLLPFASAHGIGSSAREDSQNDSAA